MAKETYIHGKRDLHTWQKRPTHACERHQVQSKAARCCPATEKAPQSQVLEFAPKLLMANGVDPALLLDFLYDLGYVRRASCPGVP